MRSCSALGSARRRAAKWQIFDPRTAAQDALAYAADGRIALVFGREDSGLTREELMLCQHTAAIPTNDTFPTMNLAQSACVFCYELSAITPRAIARDLPSAEIVERLHQRARELLLEAGFLHENNPDRIYDDLRAIAGRADLDAREVTILLGMIRQISWALSK